MPAQHRQQPQLEAQGDRAPQTPGDLVRQTLRPRLGAVPADERAQQPIGGGPSRAACRTTNQFSTAPPATLATHRYTPVTEA